MYYVKGGYCNGGPKKQRYIDKNQQVNLDEILKYFINSKEGKKEQSNNNSNMR